MLILVTGAAGFIGFHLSTQLLSHGHAVIGIDDLNNYYDVNLKKSRLDLLRKNQGFVFFKTDITKLTDLKNVFKKYQFDCVVNLAAQAGVRYSLKNPHAYIQANIVGFCNILECCRYSLVTNLVFASSSSVYGANTKYPYSEHDNTDHPLSLYAATKKSNELMAHSYAYLYNIASTGLRFFTVYGPWGRPDMALFKFTRQILNNEPIEIYNNGDMVRDFTFIDDIVEGIIEVIFRPAQPNPSWTGKDPDPASSFVPYRAYNIGNTKPIKLIKYVDALEKVLNKKAHKRFLPLQQGDVIKTYADISLLEQAYHFKPKTNIETGIKKFVEWYLSYYASK